MHETRTEAFTLPAEDGFTIAISSWIPTDQPPSAVLHIVHGMSEYADRYAPFARACASAGIAVYAHDHRGHGRSIDEASAPRGHFADEDGWNKVLQDMFVVESGLAARHPGLPLFLFGHSMGSIVGRAYLLRHPEVLTGIILSATAWRFGVGHRILQRVAESQARKHGARTPSALMRKLVFGSFNLRFLPARTPSDWLSRDRDAVDAYVQDPLCQFDCSGQLWADLLGGIYAIEKEEDIPTRLPKLPLLLIAGSHDPVSLGGLGNRQVAARYRSAGNTDVTERVYPEGRHELVNEVNRTEVWADIIAWVGANTAAPRRVSSP